MKILFLDTTHPILRQELEKHGVNCEEDLRSDKDQVIAKLKDYSGIVLRSRISVDRPVIDALAASPMKDKLIARVGAGMEHIDVAYAEKLSIRCLSSPEGNRQAVAEHALGMLLALMNNIVKADSEVRNGKWNREANRGTELEGKTIGIWGYGNTGSAFAKVLRGFNVQVLAYDKYKPADRQNSWIRPADPDEIFEKADIVSLHLPLTDETKFLADDSFFRKFRKNIYFINTSRGPIVKTADLVKNLESGKVLGACLDVIEYEETSFEMLSPSRGGKGEESEAFSYLKNSPRVILTPHIAGWSFESAEKMARILAEKILKRT